jgi:EAL domain-containing protein (putative c-di-GMP-specific phosphodiesterase class I)
MNNNTILKFAFEEIVNNKQQQQGWHEVLLRPYQNGQRIPTEKYLSKLNPKELLGIDLFVFNSIQTIQQENNFDRLSVNVMPTSLGSPVFRKKVMDLVLSNKINPSQLCIEINEQPMVHVSDEIIQFLNVLRERCTLIALDDFGSGNAHWELIQNGVIDVVKIANQKMGKTPRSLRNNYIQALFKFADSLNLTTILEGVEEHNGLVLGRAMGFKHFQGWFFNKKVNEYQTTNELNIELLHA